MDLCWILGLPIFSRSVHSILLCISFLYLPLHSRFTVSIFLSLLHPGLHSWSNAGYCSSAFRNYLWSTCLGSASNTILCATVFVSTPPHLSCAPPPSLCSLGSGHDWGERARPPGGRATDCHVLRPSAPAHELTDWPVGAGSSGPPGLLQRTQRNAVLLSGGRVLKLAREIT